MTGPAGGAGPVAPRRWQIFLTERAQKELDALPDREQRRIQAQLIAFVAGLEQGRLVGDVRKLQGEERSWRLRAGDYRVLFERSEEERLIGVFRVAHRRDAYR